MLRNCIQFTSHASYLSSVLIEQVQCSLLLFSILEEKPQFILKTLFISLLIIHLFLNKASDIRIFDDTRSKTRPLCKKLCGQKLLAL
jgi:hypothetical protein